MKFEDFEVGKEYDLCGMASRKLVFRSPQALCFEFADGVLLTRDRRDDFTRWRPYTPPPAPVVRYAYAHQYGGHVGSAFQDAKEYADTDPKRVGPVVRVELPVAPDMLARVKGGAS